MTAPQETSDGDAGAIALLRCLTTRELATAYCLAKADETDKGRHAACLMARELIRRMLGRKTKAERSDDALYCKSCAMLKSQCECWDSVNGGD